MKQDVEGYHRCKVLRSFPLILRFSVLRGDPSPHLSGDFCLRIIDSGDLLEIFPIKNRKNSPRRRTTSCELLRTMVARLLPAKKLKSKGVMIYIFKSELCIAWLHATYQAKRRACCALVFLVCALHLLVTESDVNLLLPILLRHSFTRFWCSARRAEKQSPIFRTISALLYNLRTKGDLYNKCDQLRECIIV